MNKPVKPPHGHTRAERPAHAILAPVQNFQQHEIHACCVKGKYGYFPYVGVRPDGDAGEPQFWQCNFPRGGFANVEDALREAVETGEGMVARSQFPDTLYEYPDGGPAKLPPRLRRLALIIEDADLTAEHPAYYWAVVEASDEPEVFDKPVEEAAYPGFASYEKALDAGAAALRRLLAEDLKGKAG